MKKFQKKNREEEIQKMGANFTKKLNEIETENNIMKSAAKGGLAAGGAYFDPLQAVMPYSAEVSAAIGSQLIYVMETKGLSLRWMPMIGAAFGTALGGPMGAFLGTFLVDYYSISA